MKNAINIFIIILLFIACTDKKEDIINEVVTPKSYNFERNGKSSVEVLTAVNYYKMATEFVQNFGEQGMTKSTNELNDLFANGTGFSENSLNECNQQLKLAVASAKFSTLNNDDKQEIHHKIEAVIKNFVTVIAKAKDNDPYKGVAGKLVTSDESNTKTRYFNKKGIEADQTISKILFGALFLDQILNNHLATKNLQSLEDNHNLEKLITSKNHTQLEHSWDLAYGYIFGLEHPELPLKTMKTGFLNSYIKANYKNNNEFNLFFDTVFDAFKKGRQAIVEKKYSTMYQQAKIIRKELSKMIAVRTVHYLWKGLGTKSGKQLHALSEVYGFLYAFRFIHLNDKQLNTSYTKSYIQEFEKEGGAWDISDEKITELSNKIAKDFGFTKEEAK